MKNNLRYLLYMLFVLITFPACGQTNIILPSNFIEVPIPKTGSKKWQKMNHSIEEFSVKIENNILQANKIKRYEDTEFELSNGKLVGIDRGEWGGKLIFVPSDTSKTGVEIKQKEKMPLLDIFSDTTQTNIQIKFGNIKFIFEFNGKVYFIEGLAHMGINEGALFELDITDNTFSYKKIIDFEDAPQAFTIFNDKIFIASYQNFYVIENFKSTLIFKDMFWASLYPNSIAVFDEENIFVGIRGGIVKINLTEKNIYLYRKK
ncbi:hypothetical protein ACE193_20275 [Bernardetia sp. OM2101]|uniref:hypothetical protein n=1 Tax=Bernardetia sp. OM2101 TaxID=3344876 RepID=UPI0035D02E9B